MKPHKIAVVTLLALASGGCASLPEVSAKRIRYESSYPIGGTSLEAENVVVTEDTVSAGRYKRTSKFWGVSQTVEIDEYSRNRTEGGK